MNYAGISVFAAHLGSSETMANPRICIHGFDRTRGLWPQCKSAGDLRDSNIAAKAKYVNVEVMYEGSLVKESRRTS